MMGSYQPQSFSPKSINGLYEPWILQMIANLLFHYHAGKKPMMKTDRYLNVIAR